MGKSLSTEKNFNKKVLLKVQKLTSVLMMAMFMVSCGLQTDPKSQIPDFEPSIPYKAASPEKDTKTLKKWRKQMTLENSIKGIYTAIVTPFKEDESIDYPAFEKLLKKQADAKVNGIVIFGTTGECPTLEDDEKIELIKFAKSKLPNSVKIMAGTGSNNTKKTISLSKKAIEAGADSLLIVTPPYNKPNDEGMFKHFDLVAKETKAPICLYHVPGRTRSTTKR